MSSAAPGRALVTGAGGFVGGHLQQALRGGGWQVRCVSRGAVSGCCDTVTMDLSAVPSDAQLDALMTGVDACFHSAGIAHDAARNDASGGERLHAFNVDLSVRLYQAALRNGVSRFIWLSSIKVLGDHSDAPLPVDAPYAPVGSYALSKVAAEQALQQIAAPATRLIVIRPPLVYGPGVGANFRRLLAAGVSGWPLPLARATAPRSMIGIGNLCDALLRAAKAPAGTYHVADPAPVCAARLLDSIARLAHRPARLFRMPPELLAGALTLIGQHGAYERLFTALLLETDASERALGWSPARSTEAELQETVSWYLSQR